jgi:hypothetical protein
MQSTGQTSTQALSFTSMQGSVMMYAILVLLKVVRGRSLVRGDRAPRTIAA